VATIDYSKTITQQLEAFLPHICGNPLASLVVIKGIPGPREAAGDKPFSGQDGLALDKAFGRLGWGFGSQSTRMWFGIALSPASAPTLSPQSLRSICELIDPLTIVALDDKARLACIEAFSQAEEGFLADFTSGRQTWVLGRHLISVAGFEAALDDDAQKQKVWAQLKRCVPPQMQGKKG